MGKTQQFPGCMVKPGRSRCARWITIRQTRTTRWRYAGHSIVGIINNGGAGWLISTGVSNCLETPWCQERKATFLNIHRVHGVNVVPSKPP